MAHKISPMRCGTTIDNATKTYNDGGNKITFDVTHESVVRITTLSEDGHACAVSLTSREWFQLNHFRATIAELKADN